MLERACVQLVQPFQRRYTAILSRAIQTKRSPPVVQLNEKQFGMLLICKVVLKSFDRRARLAFFHWAYLFSNRYNPRPLDAFTLAATTIQRWYRYHRSNLKKVLQTWDTAVKVGLQRHRVSTRFFPLREDETPGSAETPHGHRLPPEVLLRLPDFSKIAFQNYALCAVFTTKVRAIIVGIFGVVCVLVFAELHFSSALIRTIPNDSITAAHHEES